MNMIGMLPLNLQLCAWSRWSEEDKFPTEAGMTPYRGLLPITKSVKSLQFVNEVMKLNTEEEDGAFVRLLLKSSRRSRSFRLPRSVGMYPLNLFSPSARILS